MKTGKAHMAGEMDYTFFCEKVTAAVLIDFGCLTKGNWTGLQTEAATDSKNAIEYFDEKKYSIVVNWITEEQMKWLDEKFNYPFTCNDNPCRYADTINRWTTVCKKLETSGLLKYDPNSHGRYLKYQNNWKEIIDILKDDDGYENNYGATIKLDDNDWNQQKEKSEFTKEDLFIPAENYNTKTTELLSRIATKIKSAPLGYKPDNEQWAANEIIWNINKEIATKYNVDIEIRQLSLYDRGTFLEIKARYPYKSEKEEENALKAFLLDYGLDQKKVVNYCLIYDLPIIKENS